MSNTKTLVSCVISAVRAFPFGCQVLNPLPTPSSLAIAIQNWSLPAKWPSRSIVYALGVTESDEWTEGEVKMSEMLHPFTAGKKVYI